METYPLTKFHFRVEWGGSTVGFTEVTGLDFQVEPIEYREGNSPNYHKIKMPGMHKYSNITMKKGTYKGDIEFFEWMNEISLTKIKRRDITISLLDEEHVPVITWKISNAFPIKVQASDFKADGNEVAIETIEFVHEGLTVEKA